MAHQDLTKSLTFFLWGFFLDLGVAFLKALYTTCRVDKLLLPCIEGMAVGTNRNRDILDCGQGLDDVATGTGNLDGM